MSKVAVITGGSSGIGRCLVSQLAAKGYRVHELSRRDVQFEDSIHHTVDITNPTQVNTVFADIVSEEGHIDLLINNAGMGISGALEYTEPVEAERIFHVNFFGSFHCIRAVVPIMRANGGGRIVNVSSAAAVFAIPFQSFYSASKSALNALSLALSNELEPFGISVCSVMPGDAKTGFTGAREKSLRGDDVYHGAISKSVAVMEHDEENGMAPENVAKAIAAIAVKKNVKPLYTIGIMYKVLVVLQKMLPISFVNKIIALMYIKNNK